MTYGEIAQRTAFGRASIGAGPAKAAGSRPALAPLATNTVPTDRAGASLRLRTSAARLDALAEHQIRELEDSACIDPDKLGEALDL